MTIRWIGRWDNGGRILRLARMTFNRGEVGIGNGHSVKITLAITPKLAQLKREWNGIMFTILGVRWHIKRSWGGVFAA